MPPRWPRTWTVSLGLKAPLWTFCRTCLPFTRIKTFVYTTIRLARIASINIVSHNGRRGECRNLGIDDIAFLTNILRRNPTMYLDELQRELRTRRDAYPYIPFSAPCTGYITATRASLLVLSSMKNDVQSYCRDSF